MQQEFLQTNIVREQQCGWNKGTELTLRKVLRRIDLMTYQFATVIGAGIFVIIGEIVVGTDDQLGAGPSAMLSVLCAGIMCIPIAFCYGELGAMIPAAGGAYTYTREAFGEFPGWMIGWSAYTPVGIAAIAISLVDHIALISPHLDFVHQWQAISFTILEHEFELNIAAGLIVLMFTAISVRPIIENAIITRILVAMKILIIFLFVALAFWKLEPRNWSPYFVNGFTGVATATALMIYAFTGFEIATNLSEESKHPETDIHATIKQGLFICTLLYVVLAVALTGAVPASGIDKNAPLPSALAYIGHEWATKAISIAIVLALTSVLISFLLQQSRILFAMSRDGFMPVLSNIHPQFGSPYRAALVTGAIVAVIASTASVRQVAHVFTIAMLFTYCIVCIDAYRLRKVRPELYRPFRVPFLSFVSAIGVAFCIGLIWSLNSTEYEWAFFGGWIALGGIIYTLYRIPKWISHSFKARQ